MVELILNTTPLKWPRSLGRFTKDVVSVVIPSYNRASLVLQTLDSIRAQSYRPIEVLVVDDGSKDATPEAVGAWILKYGSEDMEARLVRQANQGAPVARNRGVLESSGEFIQFLDSDDLLSPNKLEVQARALRSNPSSSFAYGPIATLENPTRIIYCDRPVSHRRLIIKQLITPAIQTAGALFRRAALEAIGRWDEALPFTQDWEYYSRAALLGAVGTFTPETRVFLRMAVGNRLSWQGERSRLDQWAASRLRHLWGMHALATGELRVDPEFAQTLAWQVLTVTSQAVIRGWQGDDAEQYRRARDVSGAVHVRTVVSSALQLRTLLGRQAAAGYIAAFPWTYWRLRGAKGRLKRTYEKSGL